MSTSAFLLVDFMRQRLVRSGQNSDTALFLDLLLFGEMIVKTATSCLVAAIEDDQSRYRMLYRLVRADGIGEWGQVAEEALVGSSGSQHALAAAQSMRVDLAQRMGKDSWQREACVLMIQSLQGIGVSVDLKLSGAVAAKQWFELFARLRNKTKGHGAYPPSVLGALCPAIERSLVLFAENALVFRQPWAYLHRNMNGKYRVFPLTSDSAAFEPYKKSAPPEVVPNGVYVWFGRPVSVTLVEADADVADFFFANGGFTEARYELISYSTGEKREAASKAFLRLPGALPPSETEGLGVLDVVEEVFSNMPPPAADYVNRAEPERAMSVLLVDDVNRIVTLVGAGGVGKTSLALSVLHGVAAEDRFGAILWFSARDIDLLPDGPQSVQPRVLTVESAADEYVRLVNPAGCEARGFDRVACFAAALRSGVAGLSVLFVFDNFETVRAPHEMFDWISTHLCLPNKVLISTRHRDFRTTITCLSKEWVRPRLTS